MLDSWALGRRWPSRISGNVKKSKEDDVLGHLKSKNGCSGRGAPRVFLAPILKAEIFDFKERRTSDNTQSQSLARRKIPKYSMKSQSAFLGTS